MMQLEPVHEQMRADMSAFVTGAAHDQRVGTMQSSECSGVLFHVAARCRKLMLLHQTVLESKQLLQRIEQILERLRYFCICTQCQTACLLAKLRTALIQRVEYGLHDLIIKEMDGPTPDSP